MLYTPPSTAHKYDLIGLWVLVLKDLNRSNTGLLLLQLVLPDSVTGAPSGRALLPAPIAVTDREVRRAKHGVLALDVQAYRLILPRRGVFVVAEGAPEPPTATWATPLSPKQAAARRPRRCTCGY